MKNTFVKLLVAAVAFCCIGLYAELTPAQVEKTSSAMLVSKLVADSASEWSWFKDTYDQLDAANKVKMINAAQAAVNKLITQGKKEAADKCAANVCKTGATISTTSSGDFTIISNVDDISVPHTPVLSARANED